MDITGIRLASAGILLITTIFFGLFPSIVFKYWQERKKATVLNISSQKSFVTSLTSSHFVVTKKKKKNILSYDGIMKLLMFFGGGVLLATCFVHLIPEVRENFDNYFTHHKNSHPLSGQHSHVHNVHQNTRHVHKNDNETDNHNHNHDNHNHNHNHNHHNHNHNHDDDDEVHNHEVTTIIPGANDVNIANNSNNSVDTNDTDGHDDHDHHDHDHSEHEHSHDREPTHESLHSSSSESHSHNHSHEVPYVELAICGGFFFIYLLEELVHTFVGHKHDDSDGESIGETSSASGSYSPDPTIQKSPLSMIGKSTVTTVGGPGNISPDGGYVNYAIDLKNDTQSVTQTPKSHTNSHPQIFHTSSCDALVLPSPQFKASNLTQEQYLQPATVRFIQGFVVIIAFSAHSIFDGVAIGLQEEPTRLWTMFFAICSHKLVVALAVGK